MKEFTFEELQEKTRKLFDKMMVICSDAEISPDNMIEYTAERGMIITLREIQEKNGKPVKKIVVVCRNDEEKPANVIECSSPFKASNVIDQHFKICSPGGSVDLRFYTDELLQEQVVEISHITPAIMDSVVIYPG